MGSGPQPVAAIVSYRLGGPDGVSVEAGKWQWALGELGFDVRTVAGAGDVDVLVPGLQAGAWLTGRPPPPVDRAALEEALWGAEVVVVENLCSLPLNPDAGANVAAAPPGPASHHAPPRPAVAARPLRRSPDTTRRPGLAARDHQRPIPGRAGGPGRGTPP